MKKGFLMNIVTLDDSRNVSNATARFLRSLGHNVTNRLKPHEAMIALSTGWADVFICDWDLGEHNSKGHEIISSVLDMWPDIRCIMYTGEDKPLLGRHAPHFVVKKGDLDGLVKSLQKGK